MRGFGDKSTPPRSALMTTCHAAILHSVASVFHTNASAYIHSTGICCGTSLPANGDPASALGSRFISVMLGGNGRYPPKGVDISPFSYGPVRALT